MVRSEPSDDGRQPDCPEYPEYVDRVLDAVERIPAGRVMTYGDVAEWVRETERAGPRQVGRVMALYGAAVPWWRVVRADGVPLPGKEREALGHYRAEGTPLRTPGAGPGAPPRIDLRRARWDGVEAPSGDERLPAPHGG